MNHPIRRVTTTKPKNNKKSLGNVIDDIRCHKTRAIFKYVTLHTFL